MIETNKAQLIGFLGADPERKENGNGNSHLVLSVATKTSWKKPNSDEWETRTEWHRVVVWAKQAARLNLNKGDKVLVTGEIRYGEYEDEVSKGQTKIDVKKRHSTARRLLALGKLCQDLIQITPVRQPSECVVQRLGLDTSFRRGELVFLIGGNGSGEVTGAAL